MSTILQILVGKPGDHPWLEIAYWLSQILIAVTAAVGVLVAYRQVRAFGTLELLKFIQNEELRKARGVVLQDLADLPFEEWTDEQRKSAATVCSSYDVMGIVVRAGIAKRRTFKSWASSISRTFEILAPFIESRSLGAKTAYWDSYGWLDHKLKRWRTLSREFPLRPRQRPPAS